MYNCTFAVALLGEDLTNQYKFISHPYFLETACSNKILDFQSSDVGYTKSAAVFF